MEIKIDIGDVDVWDGMSIADYIKGIAQEEVKVYIRRTVRKELDKNAEALQKQVVEAFKKVDVKSLLK